MFLSISIVGYLRYASSKLKVGVPKYVAASSEEVMKSDVAFMIREGPSVVLTATERLLVKAIFSHS